MVITRTDQVHHDIVITRTDQVHHDTVITRTNTVITGATSVPSIAVRWRGHGDGSVEE